MDVIQASIPLFFALIGVEVLVARLRRDRVYRLNDSVSDLSLGILSQLSGLFIAVGTIAAFAWVQRHAAIQHYLPVPEWISRTPFPAAAGGLKFGVDGAALAAWAVVFVLDDFAYYWLHRLSHEVNVLWAGHVVHHSSEEYNLTVALRQSSLHGLMGWVFYMPMALLGVPVTMWAVCHGLNLIYQFWIHTKEVGTLPRWMEAVLNTPSHHRVHHGVNPQYQDRNYAGVFIVWDRLFGSFEPEGEPVVYGITKPLGSWNPVWANLHVFADIGRLLRRARSWRDGLRVVFGPPGWQPAYVGPSTVPHPVSAETAVKFDPPVARGIRAYAVVQFVTALAGAVALLAASGALPAGQLLAGAFYIGLTLSNVGALFEGRPWAAVSEVVRLAVLGAAGGLLLVQGRGSAPLLAGAVVLAVVSVAWIVALRREFRVADATVGSVA